MDKLQLVVDILTPLELPAVYHGRHRDIPSLSFHFFGEQPSYYGDGRILREGFNCQIDVFTRGGKCHVVVQKIRKAMEDAGFLYVRTDDNFERDTGLYHKTIIFYLEYDTEEA